MRNKVEEIYQSFSDSLTTQWKPAFDKHLDQLWKYPGQLKMHLEPLRKYLDRVWADLLLCKDIVVVCITHHFFSYKREYTIYGLSAILILLLVMLVSSEMRTSRMQARYFSSIAQDLTFQVEEGPAANPLSAPHGPYDLRLGYTYLPDFVTHLSGQGFRITAQAQASRRMHQLASNGIYPIYHQKDQAGLTVLTDDGDVLFKSRFPNRVYENYNDIPPVLVRTLLFIENRSLLDEGYPFRNPAVEWNRLGKAFWDKIMAMLGSSRSVPGGSTLATQLEKVRHSPAGITESVAKKGNQMLSATYRSYSEGKQTIEAQKRIVLNYINAVPLAAIPGYGEVIGLGDGMWAWYGNEFDDFNRLLTTPADSLSEEEQEMRLSMFEHALSLFLAQRRPSYYLTTQEGRKHLDHLANSYSKLLLSEGLISPDLHRARILVSTELRTIAPEHAGLPFTERKASSGVRSELLELLGIHNKYDLDRFDLTVQTTFNKEAQKAVTTVLRQLHDQDNVRQAGLEGPRLISGDPTAFNYAFVLYERTPEGNKLRVQADNFNGPLNINEGTKLEFGSTAKLRTLVNYLEIINNLYEIHAGTRPEQLRQIQVSPRDVLTRWTLDYLAGNPEATLRQTLEAAMQRRYSASTSERFFTGGGVHTFSNFDRTYEGRMITVDQAFSHSVNLPFIRLMRDITYHYAANLPDTPADMLDNPDDPRRELYLSRFADKEGRVFLDRFYRKYRELRGEALLYELFRGRRNATPTSAAWIFRTVRPEASEEEFLAFRGIFAATDGTAAKDAADAFRRAHIEEFNWQDRGYVARVHPLELWLVAYLYRNPEADRSEWVEASADVRQEVYSWLFRSQNRRGQNSRIWQLIEREAFVEIHKAWQRVGYPFGSLVPSYATSIGTSADRPNALAELAGIILNDGVRISTKRIKSLQFAERTPYETVMEQEPVAGKRVLSPELSAVVRDAMLNAVEKGTARGLYGAIKTSAGEALPVGAKTGTGDNRIWVYGAGGFLLDSKPLNRTSTLVFFIGDRFFGTVTVFVTGNEASTYGFTSSLAARLLQHLGPGLQPLFEERTAPPPLSKSEPDMATIPGETEKQVPELQLPVSNFFLANSSENLIFSKSGSVNTP